MAKDSEMKPSSILGMGSLKDPSNHDPSSSPCPPVKIRTTSGEFGRAVHLPCLLEEVDVKTNSKTTTSLISADVEDPCGGFFNRAARGCMKVSRQ